MQKDRNESLSERLRKGEKVICNKCGVGHYEPYNTTYDKAHAYICTHCDCYVNLTPMIDIE